MAGHRQYKITDFRFGQMILGLREKIGLTQKEVADALQVSRRTIQHWEAGTAFPDTAHLKSLIEYYFHHEGFTAGAEQEEAEALWSQADESAARRRSMFDKAWFHALLQQPAPPPARMPAPPGLARDEPAVAHTHIDWGDAPDVAGIYGREPELEQLAGWVFRDRCRLVTIQGMGGIGKTTIAAKFVQDYADRFHYVIWRSLRNAPLLPDLLLEIFQILSPVPPTNPTIRLLIDLLQQQRCLLILDNVETLHSPKELSGTYREGYEDYQRLFQRIAQSRHQSCLLLTSREVPVDIDASEGISEYVRVMKVAGLDSAASQAMLTAKSLSGPADAWEVFVHYYSGNPLALKIASATVRDLFGGDLAAFLREAPVTLHTLHQLLSNQFKHLSALERDILIWLAIEREPVSLKDLRRNFLIEVSSGELLSGLQSLLQRSLIERSEPGAVFHLLPVLLEFMTDSLVNTVVEHISAGDLQSLVKYALVKSQSPDYVRDSQVRMILHPVLAQLKRQSNGQSALADHLKQLVAKTRRLPRDEQGYAGGNLVNLLVKLNKHIKGEDFSGLVLRQLSLQGIDAQGADFSEVEFVDSSFTEPLETISAMMMSPSGKYLAATTYNGYMRCWDVATGKPLWTITNSRRTWAIAFNPDETIVACSNFHGLVSLWEVATGLHVHTFEGHQEWVNMVAFDPSGRYLASAGVDTRVCIWDIAEMKLARVLTSHSARIWSLAFSSDGQVLVSAGAEENIHVWDFQSGELLRIIRHPAKGLINVACHPNGAWLVSCCEQDPYIKLWNLHTGELLASFPSRSKSPTAITFSLEVGVLACGGQDGSVELWQVGAAQRPQFLKMLTGHQHNISVLACAQGLLATLSYGESIKIWNLESGRVLRAIEGYNRLIGANAFSPDQRLLLLGDSGGRIRFWDVPRRRYLQTIQAHTGPIWMIAFSPDGKTFATTGDDRLVRLWDTQTQECLKTFHGHTGPIWHLEFNPAGTLLASGGSAHWIMLWDARREGGATEIASIETPDDLWSLAFSPDGKLLASGQTNGDVILWDLAAKEPRAVLHHGALPVGALRFCCDGKLLITSSNQTLLKFWDIETAECTAVISEDAAANRTKAIAIGRDGRLAATGSRFGAVYLWKIDPASGQAFSQAIEGHTSRVWALALSPDEKTLATGDEEGATQLTDVQTGQVIERISIDRPYERMNVRAATGLNAAERAALTALGAGEFDPEA